MINVEFNIKSYNQLIITLDDSGLEELLYQLKHLIDTYDHFHFFSPAWSSEEGAELSEKILSGADFHYCHELSIGTPQPNSMNGDDVELFADISTNKKRYSAIQISLSLTQESLKSLISALEQLSLDKKDLSLSLRSLCRIKSDSLYRQKSSLHDGWAYAKVQILS